MNTNWSQALQWGRAYKSAEFIINIVEMEAHRIASMGPRLQERGVDDPDLALRLWSTASMGPRLQERGVPTQNPRRTLNHSRFNGAALTRARSCWPFPKRYYISESFNGAALTRARSFGSGFGSTGSRPKRLQWGRAYKSAELLAAWFYYVSPRLLQWGRAYKSAEFCKRTPSSC